MWYANKVTCTTRALFPRALSTLLFGASLRDCSLWVVRRDSRRDIREGGNSLGRRNGHPCEGKRPRSLEKSGNCDEGESLSFGPAGEGGAFVTVRKRKSRGGDTHGRCRKNGAPGGGVISTSVFPFSACRTVMGKEEEEGGTT